MDAHQRAGFLDEGKAGLGIAFVGLGTALLLVGSYIGLFKAPAEAFMGELREDRVLDFEQLEYISSAGLAILLKTQKRLSESGAALKIVNVNKHIHDIFRYSGFTAIFEIETK